MVTGTLIDLNKNGDDIVITWDKDDEAEVAKATEVFATMMARGGKAAYAIDSEGGKATISEFDPEAERIATVNAHAGG